MISSGFLGHCGALILGIVEILDQRVISLHHRALKAFLWEIELEGNESSRGGHHIAEHVGELQAPQASNVSCGFESLCRFEIGYRTAQRAN